MPARALLIALLTVAASWAIFAATPASAQSGWGRTGSAAADAMSEDPEAGSMYGLPNAGLRATTPSRIPSSYEEMNRGRVAVWERRMTPMQRQSYAEQAVQRGGFECPVQEVAQVAQLADGTPIVEVACYGGGGMIIANTNPLQATDCMDLKAETDLSGGRLSECRIPANVAYVAAARQSARN
jgi:hypothetical protein